MRTSCQFIGAVALFSTTLVTVAHTQSTPTQTPVVPAPGTTQTTTGEPRSSGGYNATFTGCVERADQLATASPAAQSTDKDSQSFMLTGAFRGAAGTTPVGTAGGPPTPASYQLDADRAMLSPHVGHQVEVTGFVTVGMGAGASTGGATTVAALDATPHVKVENIKMIAETCKR